MRESPRIRRLRSDLRSLENLRAESSIVDFRPVGDPPDKYLVRFHGKGLWCPDGTASSVMIRELHEVRIVLGASYPRMMPELNWLSPIFHANISSSGVVCLGGYGTYWVPSLGLDELCGMLWDMVRYKNFDVESPYNREAAMWAKAQNTYSFPLDSRPIRDLKFHQANRVWSTAPRLRRERNAKNPATACGGPDALMLATDDEEIIEAEVVEVEDEDIVFLD